MTSRPAVLVLVWLLGAVVATSVGLLAVRLVASQVGDPAVPPVSAQRAAQGSPTPSAVSPSVAAPPVTAPSPAEAPPPPSASRTFSSRGGSVAAQCSGAVPRLVFATPADGYALDERSVEGSELEVRFEAGDTRVKLTIGCASGAPVLLDEDVDDD